MAIGLAGNLSSMSVPIYVVDAFTAKPFSGNPAGVCILEKPLEEQIMREIAAEMKHAETAFLSPSQNGFDLRWFTPTSEVDLCGHATLASAHVLWESGRLDHDSEARFETKSGQLVCSLHGYGIQMDFPAIPAKNIETPEGLGQALGLDELTQTFANQMDVLVEVADEALLRSLNPDFGAPIFAKFRGVIVTARSGSDEQDFVSRFFAPAVGVPEDPVTGSAHCCLGPFWAERLEKNDLIGYQASERGGVVRVAVRGERVLLQGQAVTTLKGEFLTPWNC